MGNLVKNIKREMSVAEHTRAAVAQQYNVFPLNDLDECLLVGAIPGPQQIQVRISVLLVGQRCVALPVLVSAHRFPGRRENFTNAFRAFHGNVES